MSTEYGRFKDRNGRIICVDAQGVVGRINLETSFGEVLVSLDREQYHTLIDLLNLAASEHLGWIGEDNCLGDYEGIEGEERD